MSWGESIRVAFSDALADLFGFVPKLLGALLLILAGYIIGRIVGKLVTTALRAIRFNEIADKAEVDTFLRNAGVRMDPANVVGTIAKWFVYLIFFLAAFDAFGLPQVSQVVDDVVAFLPKVAVAIVVLLAGALAGNLLAGVVRGALGSAGFGGANLLATVARFTVIGFAALAALDMLEIAPDIVNGLWYAMLALVVGTLVLAFGLGGRQAASDLTLGRMLRSELEPGTPIQTGAYTGTVRTIGPLFTTLETAQGVIKVPNTELTSRQLMMTPEAYQQQVSTRDRMKQDVRQAMEEAQAAGPTRNGNGRARTVYTATATTGNRQPASGEPRSQDGG